MALPVGDRAELAVELLVSLDEQIQVIRLGNVSDAKHSLAEGDRVSLPPAGIAN